MKYEFSEEKYSYVCKIREYTLCLKSIWSSENQLCIKNDALNILDSNNT